MMPAVPLWALRNLLHEVHRQAQAQTAAAAAGGPRIAIGSAAATVRNDPNWRYGSMTVQ